VPQGPLDPTLQSEPPETDTSCEGDEAYCAACNQSFGLDHMFCPNDGARLVKLKAQPDLLLGRVFDDRYEVRAALGHGGMGTVYRGWQRSVDREVAIKVIHPKFASMRPVAKRFLREARLASRLSQPNIVNVYDFGQTEDGILYLVMELLRGRPLARDLETHRALPVRRIATLALQICDALGAAHGQGTIHRDLKPHNIVILDEPPGRDLLKILDFGLAKSLVQDTTSLVTQTDALLGTPLYMPPEQILGKPSDQRADLYSLGCILYQMVSGRPPFIGENINVVLGAHIRELPPPLPDGTPPPLTALIQHLMMKIPDDRPASAAIVHDAIAAFAAFPAGATVYPEFTTVPTVSPPRLATPPTGSPAYTAPGTTSSAGLAEAQLRRGPRRRLLAVAAGLVAIAFGVAFGVAWRSRSAEPPGGSGADGSAGSGSAAGSAASGSAASGSAASGSNATGGDITGGRGSTPIDAGVIIDAAVPIDARVPSAPPADARVPAAVTPRHKPDAGVRPLLPVDAGMPDLDLLPTRRGSDR
jgi:eukaryotic-like serine/threonine-protein kinase